MFTKLHEYLAEYKQAQAEGNQAEMYKQRFPRAAGTYLLRSITLGGMYKHD